MLVEHFDHVDGVFSSMCKIFGLCGKNILYRLCVAHKSSTHMLTTHHSCIHMVILLLWLIGVERSNTWGGGRKEICKCE
jgi:hypothetical protein